MVICANQAAYLHVPEVTAEKKSPLCALRNKCVAQGSVQTVQIQIQFKPWLIWTSRGKAAFYSVFSWKQKRTLTLGRRRDRVLFLKFYIYIEYASCEKNKNTSGSDTHCQLILPNTAGICRLQSMLGGSLPFLTQAIEDHVLYQYI